MHGPRRCGALAALLIGLAPACAPPGGQAPATAGATEVVARVGGEPVTLAQLEAWIREDLFQRETADKGPSELFTLRRQSLQRMLDERLLEAEAGKQQLSVEALVEQQGQAAEPVGDEAVQAFYAENQANLGDATLEQATPRIRSFLEQQRASSAVQAYLASLRQAAGVQIELEAPRVSVAADGPARGPEAAPVTIIEFSDYQCPFCRRAEPAVQELLKRYPDQLRFVYRHFPLDEIHPRARPAAEASLCADEQGKFWEFHEALFAGTGLEQADLLRYGAAVGLEAAGFEACIAERRFAAAVEADSRAGREAGVRGTPAFFINGILLSGAQPVEAFAEAIDGELISRTGGR